MTPPRGVEDAAPYRDGCLLFQCQQQFPQYLAGRGRGNAALVEHGCQLVHVRANDVRFRHGADGPKQLQKADAARLGRACAGEGRRVKAVEVNRQIDRHIGLA